VDNLAPSPQVVQGFSTGFPQANSVTLASMNRGHLVRSWLLGIGVWLSWIGAACAAPSILFSLQERSLLDERGNIVLSPVLDFVAQVRGEQFRNPPIPSETEYNIFSQNFFKNHTYSIWKLGQPLGNLTALPPEKIPSLYGSLEAPIKTDQSLLPLSDLDLVLVCDQPLKEIAHKPITAEVLRIVDDLAKAAFEKAGLTAKVSVTVPRLWAGTAVVPGKPDAVVALYRKVFIVKQKGATVRQIANLLLVAESITDKGQPTWQPRLNLISLGSPQNATQYGPLAIADINGDGNEEIVVRETHFERWTYSIYGSSQGQWQSRYTGREGNYGKDLPSPSDGGEEESSKP
jgi:hypothetical protein